MGEGALLRGMKILSPCAGSPKPVSARSRSRRAFGSDCSFNLVGL